MSGWEKVGAATLLALVGLIGFNLAIWRRVRDALRAGRIAERERQDRH